MNKPKIGDKIGEIRYGLEFLCQKCNKIFETKDYCDNPYFLADTIANCPTCGGKCWEVMARDTPIRKFKELKAENVRLRDAFRTALENGDIVGANHLVHRIEIIISRKLYDEITGDRP